MFMLIKNSQLFFFIRMGLILLIASFWGACESKFQDENVEEERRDLWILFCISKVFQVSEKELVYERS